MNWVSLCLCCVYLPAPKARKHWSLENLKFRTIYTKAILYARCY